MVYKASIKLQSRHRAVSFHDITARVKEIVAESGLKDGIVVENSEEGIYQGMKRLLSDPALLAHYKEKAKERGSFFSRTATVQAVEEMLDML